jgi:hypothetical protein
MRRVLILGGSIVSALAAAASASALSPGTTLSCTFSSSYGTPAWSAATGAPVGTKTVCARSTLVFDHDEEQCRDGQLYSVPMFFGTAEVDFYIGKAVVGQPDSSGFYSLLREDAEPAFAIVLFAGFIEDEDNVTPLGTACGP